VLFFEFFANKKYDGEEIPIEISITDGHDKFQQIHTLNMHLDGISIPTQIITIAPKVGDLVPIEKKFPKIGCRH
jgi:hypothetical protein